MAYSTQASGANQYRAVGLQHEAQAASPHRLIQLLMERFLTKVAMARRITEAGDVIGKGEAISHALGIVDCLRASLNHEPNAELSSNFDALYDYMSRLLLQANLDNDPAGLAEAAALMSEIKSAWDAIGEELSAVPEDAPVEDLRSA